MIKICRFQEPGGRPKVGLVLNETEVMDLSASGVERLQPLLDDPGAVARLAALDTAGLMRHRVGEDIRLLAPVEEQEVWAAGVTYVRSKRARMEESEFSASAYDKVYDAARPELFFKSMPQKVVAPGEAVGIRRDGRWNVPEPELAFVLSSAGAIVGYTIGNDMSSRDIEGENLLYLPQAKVYERSCALGPWIVLGPTEAEARTWTISLEIHRGGQPVFQGDTSPSQLKRPFAELASYLFRCQSFPRGAILLTGTGIVPPDDFTLQEKDLVGITIDAIGTLENEVVVV